MRRVFRNVLVTLVTQLVSWVLTFVVTLYVPRYVGVVGLGQLAFAASMTAVFGVVAPLGLSTVLVREIARDRSATRFLVRDALMLRVPLALVLMTLAVLTVRLLNYPPSTCLIVAVCGIGFVIYNASDVLSAALQGQEEMARQSRTVVADKILNAGLMIGLVILGAPLWVLAGVAVVTSLTSLCINWVSLSQVLRSNAAQSLPSVRLLDLAKRGMPFLGYSVFQTLYGKSDPIVLRLLTNDATVGWYDVAMRLIGSTLFIANALAFALLPTLSRLYTTDPVRFRELANRLLSLMVLCAVPVAVVLGCIPDQIVSLLHYPADFAPSSSVLRIGGPNALLWYIGCAVGLTISAADGQKQMCRSSIIAAVVGIPWCCLASWVGHRFFGNGAAGAMFSDAVLEVGLIYSYLRILPRHFYDANCYRLLLKCVLASLPMLVFFVWLGPIWKLWAAIPAIVSYGVMCLLLRCIDVEYLKMLRGLFDRKLTPA